MIWLLAISCGYKNLAPGASVEGSPEQAETLSALWTAEMAYDAAFDAWVPTAPHPVPPEQVDGTPHPWGMPDDFNTIGWAPAGDLTGSYWIDVNDDGSGGTIHSVDWVKGARVHCTQDFTHVVRQDPATCVVH